MKKSTKDIIRKLKTEQKLIKRNQARLERLSMYIEEDYYNSTQYSSYYDDLKDLNLLNR